ncbi:TIGR02391 family protein [Hwanghaeella sp. 1Z406]|uniref:TIGR02391 family protein n=1 Tax=Hwanghaeella sp. 1Z406 TaxID=3402811 RepID=UPI003B67446D
MAGVPILSDAQLEQVSRLLGDCATGSDITRILNSMGLDDVSGESTKWRRLYSTFCHYQRQDRAASKLIDYIRTSLDPAAFVKRADEFEAVRQQLNAILAFAGLQYGEDGKFRHAPAAQTIGEAHQRAKTLEAKFRGRRIHAEVVRYCKPELLQDNYFHAVFEASKGLAQRIRELSGADGDGAALVDKVLSVERPLLAINTLQTETERSEHKGFASLLKGCFAAVRNPLAHEPKLLWKGEDDAADYLSLISLLHRRLDDCARTGLGGQA